MLTSTVLLLVGLGLLTAGAEIMVRGASGLAAAARIPPLVVGLTVVAYGTSAPELVVSAQSSWSGQPEIALGNVVGSNIFNVLLILGLSALIVPLRVSARVVQRDVPLVIIASVVLLLLAWDRSIGMLDGILLCVGAGAFTVYSIYSGRKESAPSDVESGPAAEAPSTWRDAVWNVALVVIGLALLVLGSRWFTGSAVSLARDLGFSELVIGLTIVAAGTSMPELATSVMAAFRGERDIAVGNVVGSNLFNILGVLGCSALVAPDGVPVSQQALAFDLPMSTAVAIACLPIFLTGHLIARWEGAMFVVYFLAYNAYVVAAETSVHVTRGTMPVVVGFLLPLVLVSGLVPLVRWIRGPVPIDERG